MTDIVLTDPYALKPHEQAKLDRLLKMEQSDFDDQVRGYATSSVPEEGDQLIFRHPELAEMTVDSLSRLIAASQRKWRNEPSRFIRNLLHEEVKMLGAARRTIKPYVHAAVAETARGSVRDRAEKVLGRIHVPERKAIEGDIEAGMSVKEAEAAARARLASA